MEWRELQSNFKNAVTRGGYSVATELRGNESLSPRTGLKIYRDAFLQRMREYLEVDYPVCFAVLSESDKRRLVIAYAEDHPSASPTAADFGSEFPAFLAARKWPKERAWLPDMAALEWALVRAQYAPNPERQGFDRLAGAGEGALERAQFRFDPSFQLLESDWDLAALYDNPELPAAPGIHAFVIYREAGRPIFRSLDADEKEWLEALAAGASIGALCEHSGSAPDAECFSDWVSSGLLMAIDWKA